MRACKRPQIDFLKATRPYGVYLTMTLVVEIAGLDTARPHSGSVFVNL